MWRIRGTYVRLHIKYKQRNRFFLFFVPYPHGWPCEADGGRGNREVKRLAEVELVWSAKESPAAPAVQQMFICEEHTTL